MRDKDLLWQLPLTGADVMLGDRKQEEKRFVFTYFPFPKRGEGARALQTSTIYHSQSSVLLAGDTEMLQESFLPQECQGDGKLGHLVIKKLHPCEKAIPSPVSFNKLL